MRYIAVRSIRPEYLFSHVSSVRYNDIWYRVLGYDYKDRMISLENHQGDDITLDTSLIDHSDVRVEAHVGKLDEVLDKLN